MGTYVPPGRLEAAELRGSSPGGSAPAGCRSVSVPGADEDVVTMAVEACYALAEASAVALDEIDALYLASCSSPFAEHSAASEVARGLGLPPTAAATDVGGSVLAGVQTLIAARDAVAVGRCSVALVVAAERRRGDPGTPVEALGTGAAAALVTADGGVEIGLAAAHRAGAPTRWRPDGAGALRVYEDPRYEMNGQLLPSVQQVVRALGLTEGFLAAGPFDPRSLQSVGKAVRLAATGIEGVTAIGDLGSVAPLMVLADAVGDATGPPRGACVAAAPGSGALGVAVEVRAPIPVGRSRPAPVTVSYVEYLRRQGLLSAPPTPEPIVPWPATPGAWRAGGDGGGFSGARCRNCGSLSVPARQICIDCGAEDPAVGRCSRRGRVVTFNIQRVVAIAPEPAPVAVGVVRLEGEDAERGGQVSAMFTDSSLDDLRVGVDVELVYRRAGIESGLPKYGWKARLHGDRTEPASSGAGAEVAGAESRVGR